jgi:hypothetical protein
VGWNIWIFLFAYFANTLSRQIPGGDPFSKYLFYPALVIVSILVWIIVATGKLGEIRWWPSKDRFSRLVPPSIKNAAMTKGRWMLFFY